MSNPKFNGETLRSDVILSARQYFADSYQECINLALEGTLGLASHVNVDDYVAQERTRKEEMLAGKRDYTFAFLQHAYYIQTGRCLALLP